ncbi:MAG TPA: hypothetical protein VK436_00065 [Methanocella sp.]|nr:hypothetical protein [Methanocella sp.]
MPRFFRRLLSRGSNSKAIVKKCFFEKDQLCDRTCRAHSENGTCSIVDRLKKTKDPQECAAALRALCNIHKDPNRIAEDFPDLFPPPKLYYESE